VDKFFADGGEDISDDFDPGVTQHLRTSTRFDTRVFVGIHDARNASGEKRLRARTGSAGVIARFEGNDSGEPVSVFDFGQRVDLGVGGSRAAVPTLGDDCSARVEQDAANLRVFPGARPAHSEFGGATHSVIVWCDHLGLLLSKVRGCDSGRELPVN
jgi:hypothetical protein